MSAERPAVGLAPGRSAAGDFGIGLAGGIDKDGSRATELLAAGFDSVEFGTVAAGIAGHPDASAAVLAARLADWRASASGAAPRIGVGLGRPPGAPPAALADGWLAGLALVTGVADYVSLNLSAAANRPLLAAAQWPLLARAFAAVVAWRAAMAAAGECSIELAVKLPLGAAGEPLPGVARLAVAAGVDRLTVVRADGATDFARVAALAREIDGQAALVAVGGIRSAADVAAARRAGAAGVQVHRLFVDEGAAGVARLRAGG